MTDVESLKSELQQLEADLAAVGDGIKVTDQEIKTATDRKDKLSAAEKEISEIAEKNKELKDYVDTAKATLADFPTETQVLKLERKVESLKESINDSEKSITQHRTGVEAYEQRKQECAQGRKQMLKELEEHASDLEARVAPLTKGDASVASKDNALGSCDTLSSIATAREETLGELNTKIEELTAQDEEYMQRTNAIKRRLADELPKIDMEKERDIAEIRAEFAKERDLLQTIYDKQFAVNKEQQYHLARGTHIKRAPKANTEVEEAALSSRQARNAAAIIDANGKLADLSEDLDFSKKKAMKLRKEGRAAHAQFEAQKEAAMEKLREAKEKLQESNEEASGLRNLKGDLYQQLQNVRESPSMGMTPRRPHRQITAN